MYWTYISTNTTRWTITSDKATNLNAVVTVGEVLHGLELLVDDADAGLVRAVDNLLDVARALAHLLELLVDNLGGLDRGLGVELGCSRVRFYPP